MRPEDVHLPKVMRNWLHRSQSQTEVNPPDDRSNRGMYLGMRVLSRVSLLISRQFSANRFDVSIVFCWHTQKNTHQNVCKVEPGCPFLVWVAHRFTLLRPMMSIVSFSVRLWSIRSSRSVAIALIIVGSFSCSRRVTCRSRRTWASDSGLTISRRLFALARCLLSFFGLALLFLFLPPNSELMRTAHKPRFLLLIIIIVHGVCFPFFSLAYVPWSFALCFIFSYSLTLSFSHLFILMLNSPFASVLSLMSIWFLSSIQFVVFTC